MNAFVIELENKPGGLAKVAEAIAERGINITGISAVASGQGGAIGLVTNDEDGTRQALDRAGITYRSIELVGAQLQDRPGTLADAARRLADAGVNVELVLPTGVSGSTISVVLGVDDAAAASRALGELAEVKA
ncbi:MAG: ACT domain-containing protein [Chloroflexota bacterium]|nr:ACT domain-containing protein [Chloroflexota bacterium]